MHRLLEVDPESRRGICSECGLVAVKRRNRGGRAHWSCKVSEDRWRSRGGSNRQWTKEEWSQRERMREAQQNRCAVCGKELVRGGDTDHDHDSNVVRGVVCRRCNIGLGYLEDPAFLGAALEYLNGNNLPEGRLPRPTAIPGIDRFKQYLIAVTDRARVVNQAP